MPRPKRHAFIVEVTDVEFDLTNRRVKNIIEDALDYGLYNSDHGRTFENVTVKSKRRVDAASNK